VALTILSAIFIAAHFMRGNQLTIAISCLIAPLLFYMERRWVIRVMQGLLVISAWVWIATIGQLVVERMALDKPWLRMFFILSGVAFLALVAVKRLQGLLALLPNESAKPGAVAFFLTGALLTLVHILPESPMLIFERLVPGSGIYMIVGLSLYAGHLASRFTDPGFAAKWRPRIWALFSVVFFGQLILGLIGFESFLMSGKLHFPIPAMIVAGPLFRGGGSMFMPILFGVTVLLVGPAWCSYLCYIGAWDDIASRFKRRKPKALPRWVKPVRMAILIGVVVAAIVLGRIGLPVTVAIVAASTFGILGVMVMAAFSRKTGTMVHCTAYCPMGLLGNWLGKINPFRVRIGPECDLCMKCSTACRYNALSKPDIESKAPASTCTLCGDCVTQCDKNQIDYRFFSLPPDKARAVFTTLAISLHAVFMGVAMI
jgi:ferredoxin